MTAAAEQAPAPEVSYEHERVTVWAGDCLDVLAALPAESVHAVVCDPPYSLDFMGKAWDRHEDEDASFGYYLAGLVDGEGHFRVGTGGSNCEFSIKMRDDDEWILAQARRFIGHGRIVHETPAAANPQAKLIVDTKAGCDAVRLLLMRYPLRAKKLRDFIVWAEAVEAWVNLPRGNRWSGPADRTRLAALGERLRDGRAYSEVAWSGNGFQDWCRQWAAQCHRILVPGGHLIAFGGTRTYHRLACGIEDAGFEIRDGLVWAYGQGFPKNLDVGKAIDKTMGAEGSWRQEDHPGRGGARTRPGEVFGQSDHRNEQNPDGLRHVYVASSEAAQQWAGWGTALKPSHEPIVLARKPVPTTIAANVLAHGTGALNIDGTRIPFASPADRAESEGKNAHAKFGTEPGGNNVYGDYSQTERVDYDGSKGRWPSNLILSHGPTCVPAGVREVDSNRHDPARRPSGTSWAGHGGQDGLADHAPGTETVEAWRCAPGCPVANVDRQSGTTTAGAAGTKGSSGFVDGYDGGYSVPYGDTGGASRYFTQAELDPPGILYVGKANSKERPSYVRDGADGQVDNAPSRSVRECNVCGNRTVPPGGSPWPACGHEDWSAVEAENRAVGKVAHPTVKPLALMRHLVRLVTPPGGTVLDPFAGSGTTGEAALLEGAKAVLVERETDYLPLIAQRLDRHLNPIEWLRSTGQAEGTLFG